MKLKIKKKTHPKRHSRLRNKLRIRKRITGTAKRPRLTFFKSLNHVYSQLIDDSLGHTLVASSSLEFKKKETQKMTMKELSKQLGADIAKKSISKNIKFVVFDRSGYKYHGKVQSFVEAARKGGLHV